MEADKLNALNAVLTGLDKRFSPATINNYALYRVVKQAAGSLPAMQSMRKAQVLSLCGIFLSRKLFRLPLLFLYISFLNWVSDCFIFDKMSVKISVTLIEMFWNLNSRNHQEHEVGNACSWLVDCRLMLSATDPAPVAASGRNHCESRNWGQWKNSFQTLIRPAVSKTQQGLYSNIAEKLSFKND